VISDDLAQNSVKTKETASMTQNCIVSKCNKCVLRCIQDYRIAPFQGGTKDTRKLFSFFLHNAPDIKSVHSKKIPLSKHSDIFDEMMNERNFKYQKFCASNAKIKSELEKGFLDGDEICFFCKRFVCKKNQTKAGDSRETDLDCFLRHIRNSIAHGRVSFFHAGSKIYIVFEDVNQAETNLSARIVCVKADLEHWKRILSDSIL
jgi:hypothetical protein